MHQLNGKKNDTKMKMVTVY